MKHPLRTFFFRQTTWGKPLVGKTNKNGWLVPCSNGFYLLAQVILLKRKKAEIILRNRLPAFFPDNFRVDQIWAGDHESEVRILKPCIIAY